MRKTTPLLQQTQHCTASWQQTSSAVHAYLGSPACPPWCLPAPARTAPRQGARWSAPGGAPVAGSDAQRTRHAQCQQGHAKLHMRPAHLCQWLRPEGHRARLLPIAVFIQVAGVGCECILVLLNAKHPLQPTGAHGLWVRISGMPPSRAGGAACQVQREAQHAQAATPQLSLG